MKRIMACLLAVLLLCSVMLTACGGDDETTTTTTTTTTTVTTTPSPYPARPATPNGAPLARIEINSAEKLLQVANSIKNGNAYIGKTLYLTCDIDLNDVSDPNWFNDPDVVKWPLTGTATNDTGCIFRGTFDGRGYVIRGLYSEYTKETEGSAAVAMFPVCGEGAVVKNLGLEESYFKVANTQMSYITNDGGKWVSVGSLYAASFIGYCTGTYIVENSYSTATFDVTNSVPVSQWWSQPTVVGGLTGYSYNGDGHSFVRNCAFYGTVNASKGEPVYPADNTNPTNATVANVVVALLSVGDWAWGHENTYVACIANASVNGTESIFGVYQAMRNGNDEIKSVMVDCYMNILDENKIAGSSANMTVSNCFKVTLTAENAMESTSDEFSWYTGGELSQSNVWYVEDGWVLPVIFFIQD